MTSDMFNVDNFFSGYMSSRKFLIGDVITRTTTDEIIFANVSDEMEFVAVVAADRSGIGFCDVERDVERLEEC